MTRPAPMAHADHMEKRPTGPQPSTSTACPLLISAIVAAHRVRAPASHSIAFALDVDPGGVLIPQGRDRLWKAIRQSLPIGLIEPEKFARVRGPKGAKR